MDRTQFDCTRCGKCCHDLRLPVSIAEARKWLERGGDVDILCEAIPWPVEPDASNAFAAYKRKRTFPATSGTLPIRVAVTLAASFTGACPNLGDAMRCGIYEERPLVCRVYPAEVNPFIPLKPEHKLCPSEAWQGVTPFAIDGIPVDPATRAAIEQRRRADEDELEEKRALCERLGIDKAAVSNEGFLIVSVGRERLLGALSELLSDGQPGVDWRSWTLVSNRRVTVDTLVSVDAVSEFDNGPQRDGVQYVGA
ncbi:YkgJ family cysteine cluster protein [Paraburkholderia pallida]|uniref:YkgJ family cysteine cluster protein n=1 Tax=Paraburkholderia pallida TaxID=2547399 RepID=A0A4P7CY75_9BURK|nr:YkgJ family cysteine cluster protein [Paraburkholderia pallida]QBR01229.1 YkgJ family cysteine cluster protein [Paraburkholderia pallida]